jgi:hypothetical protein
MCVVAFLEGSASGRGGKEGSLLMCLFNSFFWLKEAFVPRGQPRREDQKAYFYALSLDAIIH